MSRRAWLLMAAIALAQALEFMAAWSFRGEAGFETVARFLAAHALGSGLLAGAMVMLLRERLPSIRFFAVCLMCLLLPFLNAFVLLGAALMLRLAPQSRPDSRSMGFATLRPAVAAAGVMRVWERATMEHYDEAGLASVLRWSRDPERRYRAVLRAMRLTDRESIRLLQLALRDPEDEVRLVAYGLLEHRVQALTERMQGHQARLEAVKEPAEAAALHRALAYDAWQQVNLGLTQGAVSRYYLSTSRNHLDTAIRLSPDSPGLHFLLGRVLLDLGEMSAARNAFETARRFGLVPTRADLDILERAGVGEARQREDRPDHSTALVRMPGRSAWHHAS